MLGQEDQQKEIEAIIKTFDGDMARIILEVEKLMARWFLTTNVTSLTSLEFNLAFEKALADSGYYTAVNKMVGEDFNALFPMIKEGLELGGVFSTYSTDDLARIMALKAVEVNKFSVLASTAGTTLRDNLYKYTLSDYTIEDMAKQIAIDFKGTNLSRHSTTLANTVVGEMQQSSLDLLAEGLDGVYLYVGVNDSVTRDYCKCILKEKEYYNSTQKNQVASDKRRQYNCRHRLRFVTEEYAKEQGYKKSNGTNC